MPVSPHKIEGTISDAEPVPSPEDESSGNRGDPDPFISQDDEIQEGHKDESDSSIPQMVVLRSYGSNKF